MKDHPVQALRSAGFGSPLVCSARTTHRGHPFWRLVHQLSSTQLHPATQLSALSTEHASDVASQVTILVIVPLVRMLYLMPKGNPMFVPSHPRRSPPPSHPL